MSAVAALSDPRFAGLGYRIVYKDGYTGIDFDHCVDPHTKVIDARVAEIISNVDSYESSLLREQVFACSRKAGNSRRIDKGARLARPKCTVAAVI